MKHIPIPTLTESDIARFWSKVDNRGPDDCWFWMAGCGDSGYGQFCIKDLNYKATPNLR